MLQDSKQGSRCRTARRLSPKKIVDVICATFSTDGDGIKLKYKVKLETNLTCTLSAKELLNATVSTHYKAPYQLNDMIRICDVLHNVRDDWCGQKYHKAEQMLGEATRRFPKEQRLRKAYGDLHRHQRNTDLAKDDTSLGQHDQLANAEHGPPSGAMPSPAISDDTGSTICSHEEDKEDDREVILVSSDDDSDLGECTKPLMKAGPRAAGNNEFGQHHCRKCSAIFSSKRLLQVHQAGHCTLRGLIMSVLPDPEIEEGQAGTKRQAAANTHSAPKGKRVKQQFSSRPPSIRIDLTESARIIRDSSIESIGQNFANGFRKNIGKLLMHNVSSQVGEAGGKKGVGKPQDWIACAAVHGKRENMPVRGGKSGDDVPWTRVQGMSTYVSFEVVDGRHKGDATKHAEMMIGRSVKMDLIGNDYGQRSCNADDAALFLLSTWGCAFPAIAPMQPACRCLIKE